MYIGNVPADKYQTLQKQSFTTSATDTYTLSYAVTNPQDLALFVNNVRQNPNDAYTVSGTTLTLSSAITGSDTMYAVFLGRAVETIAPATGSVTNAMLAGSIATSKLADITANGITEADIWRLTASITTNVDPISSNLERSDSTGFNYIGTGMSVSSGIWTFPSTGIWKVSCTLRGYVSASDSINLSIDVTNDNGSNYYQHGLAGLGDSGSSRIKTATMTTFVDVTDTSQVKVKFATSSVTSGNIEGDTDSNRTFFEFIRLGDT